MGEFCARTEPGCPRLQVQNYPPDLLVHDRSLRRGVGAVRRESQACLSSLRIIVWPLLFMSAAAFAGRDDKADMFDWLYGDSVCFVIDSIHRISYYSYDTLSEDSPYNFNSPHYQHTYIDPNPGNGCDAAKSSHTYTITEEQINNRLGTQP